MFLHCSPFPKTAIVGVVTVHYRQNSEERRSEVHHLSTQWKEVCNTEYLKLVVYLLVSRERLQSWLALLELNKSLEIKVTNTLLQHSGFCKDVTFVAFCSKMFRVYNFNGIKIHHFRKVFFLLSVVLLGFDSSPRGTFEEVRLVLCVNSGASGHSRYLWQETSIASFRSSSPVLTWVHHLKVFFNCT